MLCLLLLHTPTFSLFRGFLGFMPSHCGFFKVLFQMSGLVLLVAMIGAITLTLRSRDGVKRQNIPQQLERTREEAVALRKVESGKGIG